MAGRVRRLLSARPRHHVPAAQSRPPIPGLVVVECPQGLSDRIPDRPGLPGTRLLAWGGRLPRPLHAPVSCPPPVLRPAQLALARHPLDSGSPGAAGLAGPVARSLLAGAA